MKATPSLVPVVFVALSFAACGSGPDAASGSAIAGVLVVPGQSNGNGPSPNQTYIAAATPAAGGFAAWTAGDNCGGPSCGASNYADLLGFAPATLDPVTLASSATGNDGQGYGQEVASAPDGSIDWAGFAPVQPTPTCTSGFPGVALWTTAPGSAASAPSPAPAPAVPIATSFPLLSSSMCGTFPRFLVGLVADADAAYVAVAVVSQQSLQNGNGPTSPDSPQWGNAINGGQMPPAHLPAMGSIYAVAAHSGDLTAPPPAVSTTFDAAMLHTLVDAGSSLCWLDGSHVSCAPKGWATGPVPAPTMLDRGTQVPAHWTLVAIAAHGSTLAWAAAPDPSPGTTGCMIWTSQNGGAATPAYDGSQASFFCHGLAVDDAYVYVTMNAVPTGSGQVVGDGIARAPIAGGSLQTLPLQSQRWYGPRRVLVDDTYVYAVDPSYVVRVPKSAFGP